MPFVFAVVGIGLLVIAIRGTQATAFQLLQSEFSGPNSFIHWALAIFILGGIGYIPGIRPVTRWMIALVIVVIFLKNKTGLFASFNQQIANPVAPAQPAASNAGASAQPAQPAQPAPMSPNSLQSMLSPSPNEVAISTVAPQNTATYSPPYIGNNGQPSNTPSWLQSFQNWIGIQPSN